MRRRAFNLLCAVSLLVFAANVTLWVRSYWARDDVQWWGPRIERPLSRRVSTRMAYGIFWTRGTLSVARGRFENCDPAGIPPGWRIMHVDPTPSLAATVSNHDRVNLHFAGFALQYQFFQSDNGWFSFRAASVPLWLFLPAALPPSMWWRRYRRRGARGFPIEANAPAAPA